MRVPEFRADSPRQISQAISLSRRNFLRAVTGAGPAAALFGPAALRGMDVPKNRKAIIVTFGGGARDDETGTGMTSKQLRDEAMTLVIAGSETTGNTIAWACYLLTQHPEIQERLQQEVDDAGCDEPDKLPFTRAVITETLRLYSPVWILPRRAVVDVELDGYLLPAGSRIMFSPYALSTLVTGTVWGSAVGRCTLTSAMKRGMVVWLTSCRSGQWR